MQEWSRDGTGRHHSRIKENMPRKTCSWCKERKSSKEFGRLAAAPDDLNYRGRRCISSKNKVDRKKRKPRSEAESKLFYQSKYQNRKGSPAEKARENVRARIYNLLRKSSAKRSFSVSAPVGFSASELRKHLERQFTAGMSWENYGTYWHIDHIVPPAPAGDDLARLEELCHFTNLQPLTAKENLSKGAR